MGGLLVFRGRDENEMHMKSIRSEVLLKVVGFPWDDSPCNLDSAPSQHHHDGSPVALLPEVLNSRPRQGNG